MLSKNQFLELPYGQRLHYVQELESRLDDAKNIASERPIFIKIRHAMDSKDWGDAAMLIAEAKRGTSDEITLPGVRECLVKPFRNANLIETIARIIPIGVKVTA